LNDCTPACKPYGSCYDIVIAAVLPFNYALFFMDNDSLNYLNSSEGWEVGVGPSIVVVDKGNGQIPHVYDIAKTAYMPSSLDRKFDGRIGIARF